MKKLTYFDVRRKLRSRRGDLRKKALRKDLTAAEFNIVKLLRNKNSVSDQDPA